MQSACYIMHGLSLSQRSFTPCCASPPTAPHTHTHPVPCVDSHILYSSTLTHVECVLSNSQPVEWKGKTERKTESGWGEGKRGDWKWKRQSGKTSRVKCTFTQRWRICMCTCVCHEFALRKIPSFTRRKPLWAREFSICLRPHNPK